MSSDRRPLHQRPAFVAWACLLFLVGWLAHGWHAASVHHDVCAAHGELVERADPTECGVADHHDLDSHGASLTATHPHDAGHHEHCAFVALSQPTVPIDALRLDALDPPAAPYDPAPVRARIGDGERRYLLAPKQSPPARGTQRA